MGPGSRGWVRSKRLPRAASSGHWVPPAAAWRCFRLVLVMPRPLCFLLCPQSWAAMALGEGRAVDPVLGEFGRQMGKSLGLISTKCTESPSAKGRQHLSAHAEGSAEISNPSQMIYLPKIQDECIKHLRGCFHPSHPALQALLPGCQHIPTRCIHGQPGPA